MGSNNPHRPCLTGLDKWCVAWDMVNAMEIIPYFTDILNKKITILAVYVDDFIITGDDEEITKLKECLSQAFEVKDLGKLKYFLGIEVAYLYLRESIPWISKVYLGSLR